MVGSSIRTYVRRTRSWRLGAHLLCPRYGDHGRQLLNEQDGWVRARTLGFYDGLPDHEREMVSDLLVRLAGLIDELAAGPG